MAVDKALRVLKARLLAALEANPRGSDEVKALFEAYLTRRGVEFETNMAVGKIGRVDRMHWKPPVLTFSLVRHPGFRLRRQTWEYDFEADQVRLRSEGKIPQSPPYKAGPDAAMIVDALVNGTPRIAILNKGELLVVNGRQIPGVADAPQQTTEGRIKRLKQGIRERMTAFPEFEETTWRNMLAYRPRQPAG